MTDPSEERMISKIQKLLDRAAHPNTPEHEANSALAMADMLMAKYALDEAMIQAAKSPEEREKPERRDVQFFDPSSPLRGELAQILRLLSDLTEVKVVRLASTPKHAAVGFAADIDYLELLFTSVRNQFQQKMYPKWDPEGSIDENIYHFKIAGYKWYDIWREGATKHRTPMPFNPPPKDGGAMIRAYKRHAAAVGDDRVISTQRFDAYRESYKAGFVHALWDRVYTMTQGRTEAMATAGSGAEIAIRDKRQDVLEALYFEFPELRPETPEQIQARLDQERAEARKRQEEHQAWLDGLTPKQRAAYYRKLERDEAASARYWARQDARNARDHQGFAAGKAAASSMDLSGGRNNIGGNRRGIER